MYDILIKNGQIIDGSGKAAFCADIAVKDGKIAKIGDLSNETAEKIIDAQYRYVTPGFFDMHSHADLTAMLCPDMEGLLGQGITSCFTGHCGMTMAPAGRYFMGMLEDVKAFEEIMPLQTYGKGPGSYPASDTQSVRKAFKARFGVDMDWNTFGEFRDHLKKDGIGVNMYMEVGHAQIRMDAMGFDYARTATQDEIDVMRKHVAEAMEAGATGLSFGLDYAPGKYAGSDELNQLAECIKSYNGILAAHIRNYGKHPDTQQEFHTIDGIKELMDIGLKHGLHVHISHIGDGFAIKPFDQFMMDASAQRTLQIIDEYRNKSLHVTWDVLVPEYIPWFFFPDLAGLVKYYIAACGGKKAFAEKLKSPAYQYEIAQAIKENKNPSFGWFKEEYEILRCKNKAYEGKTIKQIADMLDKEPVYAMFDILMEDMDTRYRQNRLGSGRHTNVFQEAEEASMGLDNCGYDYNWEGEKPDMPVDYSTPTSYCGMITFMEKRRGFPLEDTIRKMTGNAATALGVKDRGFLKEGLAADIVVIDYKNLRSNENFTDPRCKPDGIDYVLVNGKIAVDHGVHTHVRAGVIANGLEA